MFLINAEKCDIIGPRGEKLPFSLRGFFLYLQRRHVTINSQYCDYTNFAYI